MRKRIVTAFVGVLLSSNIAQACLIARPAAIEPFSKAVSSQFNLKAQPLSSFLQEACGGAFVLQESLMACQYTPFQQYYAGVTEQEAAL